MPELTMIILACMAGAFYVGHWIGRHNERERTRNLVP